MRKFSVTVNGNVYEVEIEEISEGATAHTAPVATAPAVASAPKATPKAAPSGKGGSVAVNSPMPGTILKINVTPGQAVKKGDILCVLEAMKMENDIPAPEDGTVASVNVQKGASVNSGDVLVTLN